MVLRHMQSVIAGCKPVLPPLHSRETSPPEKISRSRPRTPVPTAGDAAYSRLMTEKGRMESHSTNTPARAGRPVRHAGGHRKD